MTSLQILSRGNMVAVGLLLLALLPGSGLPQTPAAPLSFEVASVKPAPLPSDRDDYAAGYEAAVRAFQAAQGLRISGQRVNVTDNSLRDLIRLAYRAQDHQISGPRWIADEKYEIAAIMPAGTDRSQGPEMLRSLLAERFHLALRREMRQMAVYALVVAKGGPKLKTAKPSRRSSSFAQRGGNIWAIASPMSVFADLLERVVDRPVVDRTEIAGWFDFSLSFRPELAPETSEATASTLATALRDQLGLQLERRQLPVEVLVVEHADRVPAEN